MAPTDSDTSGTARSDSSIALERFLYGIPGDGSSATFRWNMGVVEKLVDDGEAQGPHWVRFFDPDRPAAYSQDHNDEYPGDGF